MRDILSHFWDLETFKHGRSKRMAFMKMRYPIGEGLGEVMTKGKDNKSDEYKWNLLALWV